MKILTPLSKKVFLHGAKGRPEDDIKAILGQRRFRTCTIITTTAFIVLESETYDEAILRNTVPIPVEVKAQNSNQRHGSVTQRSVS